MPCPDCERLLGTGRRNILLRRAIHEARRESDEVFRALCNDRAVTAMGELWASGMECGPEDYEAIVEQCLQALNAFRKNTEDRKRPAQDGPGPALCQADDASGQTGYYNQKTPWLRLLPEFHSDRDLGDENDRMCD